MPVGRCSGRESDSERSDGAERGRWGPASDVVRGAAGAKPPDLV